MLFIPAGSFVTWHGVYTMPDGSTGPLKHTSDPAQVPEHLTAQVGVPPWPQHTSPRIVCWFIASLHTLHQLRLQQYSALTVTRELQLCAPNHSPALHISRTLCRPSLYKLRTCCRPPSKALMEFAALALALLPVNAFVEGVCCPSPGKPIALACALGRRPWCLSTATSTLPT